MVNLSDCKFPSDHVKERALRMLVQRRGLNEFRITPKERGHSSKLVRFVKRSQWVVMCEGFYDGKPCEANSYKLLCAHVWAAIRRIEINNVRAERKAQREAGTRLRAA